MEMRLFWTTDQVKIGHFTVKWTPGQENLADYFTKHHDSKHHRGVRTWYLHENTSQRLLPRAAAPSALRGCVGNLPRGYSWTSPLPRTLTQRVPVRRPNQLPRGSAHYCCQARPISTANTIAHVRQMIRQTSQQIANLATPVSYTHLTLPTILLV